MASENLDKTMHDLFNIVLERREGDPTRSYVAKLSQRGRKKIAQKVGEEAVETVIAALKEKKKDTINESADLLFHLTMLWADKGITPEQVSQELRDRMGISGLDEKAARKMK